MNFNRRDALTTLGALALTPATALAAAPAAAAKAPAVDLKVLADTAEVCVDAAKDCIEHCIAMLSTGDKSMADCYAAVRAMKPMCEALEALAKLNSPHLKAHAATCAKTCRDCEKACKPHAAEMAECKACMEACGKCAALCEKVAA
ncbi:MAG: Csp1 family four helix bundle copper storage protein [Myxococcaceae bacterium]|nr:Csp1 family four helix bundle copper storage protein [Myxococcaceae bacterium]